LSLKVIREVQKLRAVGFNIIHIKAANSSDQQKKIYWPPEADAIKKLVAVR